MCRRGRTVNRKSPSVSPCADNSNPQQPSTIQCNYIIHKYINSSSVLLHVTVFVTWKHSTRPAGEVVTILFTLFYFICTDYTIGLIFFIFFKPKRIYDSRNALLRTFWGIQIFHLMLNYIVRINDYKLLSSLTKSLIRLLVGHD